MGHGVERQNDGVLM